MKSHLGARIAQIIPTIFLVSVMVFCLQQLMPGDPALVLAGEERDPAVLAQIREELWLDRPLVIQYFHWIGNVLQGDLGFSWRIRQPVLQLVATKLPVTMQLAAMAFVISVSIGVPMGILSAVKKNTFWDYIANGVGLAGLSTPNFWLGIMLILVVSVQLGWLPPSGYVPLTEDWRQSLATTIMPAFVLGNALAAVLMRHTRSAMLTALEQDYVRTARAKGLVEYKVVLRHALMQPFFNAPDCLRVLPVLRTKADDVFKPIAYNQHRCNHGVELEIAVVAEHQAVLGVIHHEGIVERLYR